MCVRLWPKRTIRSAENAVALATTTASIVTMTRSTAPSTRRLARKLGKTDSKMKGSSANTAASMRGKRRSHRYSSSGVCCPWNTTSTVTTSAATAITARSASRGCDQKRSASSSAPSSTTTWRRALPWSSRPLQSAATPAAMLTHPATYHPSEAPSGVLGIENQASAINTPTKAMPGVLLFMKASLAGVISMAPRDP